MYSADSFVCTHYTTLIYTQEQVAMSMRIQRWHQTHTIRNIFDS